MSSWDFSEIRFKTGIESIVDLADFCNLTGQQELFFDFENDNEFLN